MELLIFEILGRAAYAASRSLATMRGQVKEIP